MATIKVHLLNFHHIYSHLEIVLENTSANTFYRMNRWSEPMCKWVEGKHKDNISKGDPEHAIKHASSTYSFTIAADPKEITKKWNAYWDSTSEKSSILGKNCAEASQWFLEEFADIPPPSLSYAHFTWNHFALGIMWPSFIACPVTLPGRIMDNAKFHIEPKKMNKKFRIEARKMNETFRTIAELPDKHENKFKNKAIKVLKKLQKEACNEDKTKKVNTAFKRFNELNKFYYRLQEISIYVDDLRKRNDIDGADRADTLVNSLFDLAIAYLNGTDDGNTFKEGCLECIKNAKPALEIHHGWKRLLRNLELAVLAICAKLFSVPVKVSSHGLCTLFDKTINSINTDSSSEGMSIGLSSPAA